MQNKNKIQTSKAKPGLQNNDNVGSSWKEIS